MFRIAVAAIFLLILISTSSFAQTQTVGLLAYDSTSFEGYTLFAPIPSTSAYLIDNYGRVINHWPSAYGPAMCHYLLEDGTLLRTGKIATEPVAGAGGLIYKQDWEGNIIWQYQYYDSLHLPHHDIEPMPNGNVLVLAWEFKTAAEAIANGRDPALLGDTMLWPEHIVEIQPIGSDSGEIVWEWHLWDHLIQDFDPGQANYGIVADHPELMDINFVVNDGTDWIHGNSIDYNPDLDQIVLGGRPLCEFYVIDHSTTTAEAAGHTGGNRGMGGDILYRWGNPLGYDAGTADDQRLFQQHDARWIESHLPGGGNFLVFNNGSQRPDGRYSTVDEIISPVDEFGNYPQPAPGTAHGPADPFWTYIGDPPTSFFGVRTSGAHRLPNGNTLITIGPKGTFLEVTNESEIVWKYINPDTRDGIIQQGQTPPANGVFRCHRYAPDYPGLAGKDLTPGGPLEIYPVYIASTMHSPDPVSPADSVIVTSLIADPSGIASAMLYVDTGSGYFSVSMYDDGNHHDGNPGDSVFGAVIPPQASGTTVKYYVFAEDNQVESTIAPPIAPAVTYGYTVIYDSPYFIINEMMIDNQTSVEDPQGEYENWVELRNGTGLPASPSGLYMTDDFATPDMFALPDTLIGNGELLVIWTDGETQDGSTHANFTLSSAGGEVAVVASDLTFLDSLTFDNHAVDISYGRYPDGSEDWQFFSDPTPGEPNDGCICGEFTMGFMGNANCSEDGKITLTDVSRLIDYVYISKKTLCCLPDGDVNGSNDGKVTLGDITLLIDHLYISKTPMPACP